MADLPEPIEVKIYLTVNADGDVHVTDDETDTKGYLDGSERTVLITVKLRPPTNEVDGEASVDVPDGAVDPSVSASA